MKLELRGITKRFGTLVANDSIDLVVEPGEIHALLGENGAGKSTLMNVLYGLYDPDDGEILLDDQPVTFAGPGDAVAAGIGMVHQHFMLVPVFTVAESVALGYEPAGPLGIIDQRTARKRVKEISDRFGFDVDPDAVIEDLPVGVQQRVEIIKALSREAEVLILDEPTAVLTPQETDELMAIMRQLKSEGAAIVFSDRALSQSFTLRPGPTLALPGVGNIDMAGVLRSEVEEFMTAQIAQYIRDPVVRVESTLGPTEIRREGQARLIPVYADVATGGAIVLAQGAVFALAYLFGPRQGVVIRALRRRG